MLSGYYRLTKPGIVYGNALTAAAGYFFGIHESINFLQLLLMLLGISGIVASGCVFNNYIDRDIDGKMEEKYCLHRQLNKRKRNYRVDEKFV